MNADHSLLWAWPTFVAFISVSAFVWSVGRLFHDSDQRLRQRLTDSGSIVSQPSSHSVVASALLKLGARLWPNNEAARRVLRNRLSQAGLYSSAGISCYLAAQCGLRYLAPVLWLAAAALHHLDLQWASLAALIGYLAPGFWLRRRAHRRQLVLARSLPDFLDLMVACLEGGQSVQAAIQRVTHELQLAHPVLSQEMSIVQHEIELGGTPASALKHCADRSGTDSIRSLGAFIEQTQRFGTTLVEALRVHADTLRTQREQRAEEKAQRAAVKILFPTLLFIFPAIFVVLAGPAAIQLHEHFSRSDGPFSSTNRR